LGEVRIGVARTGSPARLTSGPAGLEIAGQELKLGQEIGDIGIIRIDRLRSHVGGHGLVKPQRFGERIGLVDQQRDRVRLERKRPVEPRQRFVIAAQLEQRCSDIVADLRTCALVRIGPQICLQRVVEPLQVVQHEAALFEHRAVVGQQQVA
jgi:hypothetical protein